VPTAAVVGEDYGPHVDTEWAQERLEKYLSLCKELSAHQRANRYEWDDHCTELNDRATEAKPS